MKNEQNQTVQALLDANDRLRKENKALAERLAKCETDLQDARVKASAWMIIAAAADGNDQYGYAFHFALEIAQKKAKDNGKLRQFYRDCLFEAYQRSADDLVRKAREGVQA